jgi:4-amino-4-deoxy-L-arabinose transferase-like glycosyltransferase
MPMLCGAARFANPDALLNLLTVLTLALFWFGLPSRRGWWFLSLGAASGLAVLAKGPVGLVLPAAVIFLYFLWERRLGVYWDGRWLWTCGVFTLTAVPWYLWVGLETHGDFLKGFLWKHNVERATAAMENHNGFPGFYLVVLLVGTTPWSIFLLASWWFGCWSALRRPMGRFSQWWTQAADRAEQTPSPRDSAADDWRADLPSAYRLLLCWIAVYCVFFSIAATKLPNYVLPVIAPCAILIARLLERWQTGAVRLPGWLAHGSVAALFLVGTLMSVGIAIASGLLEVIPMRGTIPELQPWAAIGAVPLSAALLGWWFLRRQQFGGYIVTVAVAAIMMLAPLAAYGAMVFNRYKAPAPLVEQAQALRRDEDIRIGCWQMEHLPSLNFYVQRNIDHLEKEQDMESFMRSPLRVYLFLPRKEWDRLQPSLNGLGRLVAQHHDMYHREEIVVVTNR